MLIGRTCAYSDMCTLRMHKISKAGRAMCIAMTSVSLCVGGCCINGHHIYKATWTPTVGEILAVTCTSRPGNDQRTIRRMR